jgi:hypothetical protein
MIKSCQLVAVMWSLQRSKVLILLFMANPQMRDPMLSMLRLLCITPSVWILQSEFLSKVPSASYPFRPILFSLKSSSNKLCSPGGQQLPYPWSYCGAD